MEMGGGVLIFNRGVSLCQKKNWRLMFGLKTCDFPAKNASSSKVTANRTERGRRACEYVYVHLRAHTSMPMVTKVHRV